MLRRLVPRLRAAFPGVNIKLRGDADLACLRSMSSAIFPRLSTHLGIATNRLFQRQTQPLQRKLRQRYRRSKPPQRSLSSFLHRAGSWSYQRRICYKAEKTAAEIYAFVITDGSGLASEVFVFTMIVASAKTVSKEFKTASAPTI